MSAQSNRKTNSKKRKRPKLSAEEQLQEERKEKYNKLVYMARKALHKEAKVVKSFECQKVVRKLKQCSSSNLEQRLKHAKSFSLDGVVDVCMQRLGVPNLDPRNADGGQRNNAEEMNGIDKQLIERMLQHKRLADAMETWNEKVTEYRRWYLRRQERVSEVPDFMSHSQKKMAGKNQRVKGKSAQAQSSDLFVCLLGAKEANGGHYGPAGGDEEVEYAATVKKKNRPGQRSRKAKAMAIEARKEGRTWDRSLNWREKKPKPEDEDGSLFRSREKEAPVKAQPEAIAAMGKTWKEEGKAHPSWAARQSQKSGIVEFTGKKITFD